MDLALDSWDRELHGGLLERQSKNWPPPPVFHAFPRDLITDVLTFLLHRVSLRDLPRRNIWKLRFRYNSVWESLFLASLWDDRALNYSARNYSARHVY